MIRHPPRSPLFPYTTLSGSGGIADHADRDVLDRIGRLLEKERRLASWIGAALDRMRGIVAPDAVDAPDLKNIGLAYNRDRGRRHRKNGFRTCLRLGSYGLRCNARQRHSAGGENGPAIDRGHQSSRFHWSCGGVSNPESRPPQDARSPDDDRAKSNVQLVLDFGRQPAAVRGKFNHYLLMQPHV